MNPTVLFFIFTRMRFDSCRAIIKIAPMNIMSKGRFNNNIPVDFKIINMLSGNMTIAKILVMILMIIY